MTLTITGNPILDLATVQTMSILYLSEAALFLVKWEDIEDSFIAGLSSPPAAAWYKKVAGTSLKMVPNPGKPCMKTTGLSIQSLSRLSNTLPEYGIASYLAKTSLHETWKAIAALQLQYCLEYLEESPFSLAESCCVLEGGVWFLNMKHPLRGVKDFLPDLHIIYHHIMENLDPVNDGTMDLAIAIQSICTWHNKNKDQHRDELLTTLVLEVLNRKSRTGLFHYGPYGYASAPMGQQFFILNALLQSFPYVQLDHVLEEVFNTFTTIYRVAYKDSIELFAFQRKNISYTAFDIGALLSCLNSISKYSSQGSEQKDMINHIVDTLLAFLTQSYRETYETEIRKLLKWICLTHEGGAKIEEKPSIHTLFPKRIHLLYPGPEINWSRKGMVDQADIFFLCSTLLSLLDGEDPRHESKFDWSFALPELDTLKMLYRLLGI